MYDWLKFEKNGSVVTLTMNRPDIRNPLGEPEDVINFEEASKLINNDRDVRCVILTGAGKAFSAGGNVKNMQNKSGNFSGSSVGLRDRYKKGIHKIIKAIWNIEVPVIAAINGPAVGAGFDLACMCDFRIMSNNAFLAESFINLGIIPGDEGAFFLQRLIGYQKAAELTLTGRKVSASEALELGLVLKKVDPNQLIQEAKKFANEIAKKPKNTIRYTKRLLKMGAILPLKEFLDFCALLQGVSHNHKEHKNALKNVKRKNRLIIS